MKMERCRRSMFKFNIAERRKNEAGELGLNDVPCSTAKSDVSSYVRLV